MNLSVLDTVLDNDEKSQIGKWKRDSFGVFIIFYYFFIFILFIFIFILFFIFILLFILFYFIILFYLFLIFLFILFYFLLLFLNNVYLSYMHKYASYCFASQCTFNEEKLLWSLIFSLIFIIKSEVHIHRKK